MEKALLQEMVRDREMCIQFLEKKLEGQEEKATRLKKEQDELSERKQKDRDVHRSELMQLWKDYDGILSPYQDLKDALDTRRQHQQENGEGSQPIGPSLETYIEIMKEVPSDETNGSEETSNYVVKMQSQLCKAMHGMGVMETQRHMTKGQTEHIQKKAKDVLTEMREEQSNVELKMVNDLIVADNSKREVDSKRTEQHQGYSKQKNDLMEKIERQLDEAIEDDAEAENDEALEEAKEELKEVLQEGRQEMERLEKLNAEAEEKIEALKIKAALAQGQDVVKDIVTSIEEEFAEQEGSDDEGSDDGSY
eukprot:CAMPEP_0116123344 /NCGR_PEP_ID=MMETSP0329-20121206/4698_1 /TAXON_ID=697910 /ORGANISM="Pseudo-nitzschia arenysensis, Strain B593" /LENGTH=307 /DNA_ID=CAMNT_0003617253 /DNA_START=249 /DNA_END=1172 /DNA_ORIENTATION=-